MDESGTRLVLDGAAAGRRSQGGRRNLPTGERLPISFDSFLFIAEGGVGAGQQRFGREHSFFVAQSLPVFERLLETLFRLGLLLESRIDLAQAGERTRDALFVLEGPRQ